jgi:hypothetical protein
MTADTDTKAIEEAIASDVATVTKAYGQRPSVVSMPQGEDRTRQAMQRVDRKVDMEAMQVEAFIDAAIHQRVVAVRGAYLPGPRDAYVRKMVLEAINSITGENSHRLD